MSRRAAASALALVLLAGSPASAHTALSASVPADGTTTAAPEEVALSFSGPVLAQLSAVTVVGPDGTDAADGRPGLDGDTVVQPLDGPLETGRWTVSYRVVAADGHPVTGQLSFTVAGAAAPADASAAPSPDRPVTSPGDAAQDAAGGSSRPAVLGGLLAGGLGLGALLVLARRRRSGGG